MPERAYTKEPIHIVDSSLVKSVGITIGGVPHDLLVYNKELGVWQTDESFVSGAFGQTLAACVAAPNARLTAHQFSFLRGDVAAFSGVTNKTGALQRVYESAKLKLASCSSGDTVGTTTTTLQDEVLLELWQIARYRYLYAHHAFKDEHMSGKLSEECRKALSVLKCIERCQASSSLCTYEFDKSDVVQSVRDALKHSNLLS